MISKAYDRRMEAYRDFLDTAVRKRKANISAKELAEKMEIVPASLYRMESGVNDVKVSTLLAYLDGFGFTIEVVPYEKETESAFDYVLNTNDSPVLIENTDRRTRLKLLQRLLKAEEEYIAGER
ncbi:MAG: helix-turn-helix domain-containing protein [Ruminococcaceae bacterium]|nr:helix-turn-helix domain-containing protein [Oscillospiraceae bacterium]